MTETFGTDATTALARATIRKWLGLELELSEHGGEPTSGLIRRGEYCDLVRTVEGGARCVASVNGCCEQSETARAAVVTTCHAGMQIVARSIGTGAGIYVCGVRGLAPAADDQLAISDQERASVFAKHPAATNDELTGVRALLDGVGEVLSAHRAVSNALLVDKTKTKAAHPFSEIVGKTPAVRQMAALLEKVVKTSATVLIHGESGTGKELIARALHYHGPRAKKNFVVQNCSAFNDNLLESALFGHVRGSFTGAVKDQKGLFEVADGGTFFLDEIGDMSAALQVKLLRVLQEGTFTPVGGTKPVKVDVRIIAASHKDLAAMVARREFREDLFFRVNVLKITVPPLRERVGDIPELARHFAAKSHRGEGPAPVIDDDAMAKLCAYSWPGNIRELENEIERMRVLGGNAAVLTGGMVSARVAAASGTVGELGRTLAEITELAQSDAILSELRQTGWKKDLAAHRLGISRAMLDALCLAHGIEQV